MSPRSQDFSNDDKFAYSVKQSKAAPKAADYSTKISRTVGATLGPRSSGIQKRDPGSGKRSALVAVLDLMPYHQYRARQRRDAAMGESVWDDELEAAFMEADAKIPKIGRTKYNMDGKLRGRNELIAEYIFQRTGKRRSRKQVSSHIQVLKNLLKNNPEITKNRASDEPISSRPPEGWSEGVESPSAYSEPTPSLKAQAFLPGRPHSSIGYSSNNISFASPPPSAIETQFGLPSPNIELTAFVMMVGSKSSPTRGVGSCFHTYSQLSQEDSTQAPPVDLFSLPSWRSCFPQVADIVDEEATSDSNMLGNNYTMLHVQASISTMTTDAPVRTQVEVSVPINEYDCHQWECVTRIYDSGKMVGEFLHRTLQMTENYNHGMRRLTLPFEDDFWSTFYTKLSKSHSGGNERRSRRRDELEGAAIKGVTVVQELFSYPVQGLGDKQRSAVLMWQFSKADVGSQGKAVWRRVVRPPAPAGLASVVAGSQFGGLLGIDTAVANNMNAWSEQEPRLPISPYEDLSPGPADGMAYYSYQGPHSYSSPADPSNSGLDSALLQGSLPAIAIDDMNVGYLYPGQRHSPFEAYSMGIPTTNQHSLNQYLRDIDGSGTNNSCGAAWPPHLNPISERQSQGVVDDNDVNINVHY
ncbi:TEA/ATTS domain family-domain-containing protein [Trichophaea hybrida]|nr:TEA/ATTS domain family-domain-containing protein [Trichophaea hybrida]